VFIQFHFGIDAETPLEAAHDLASRIEARIEEQFPLNLRRNLEIVSHIEPALPPPAKVHSHILRPSSPQLRQTIEEAIKRITGADRWNHLNIIEEGRDVSVSVVAYFDGTMSIADAHHQTEEIEAEIRRGVPSLKRCIVHSEPIPAGNDIKPNQR
jgi:divalent metal cation (Fe/Co/Zn/Cd) transporter